MLLPVLNPLAALRATFRKQSSLPQFRAAAELVTDRLVDMKTAVPMAGDVPTNLPSKLTAKCYITRPHLREHRKFSMRFLENGLYFGFISADMKIRGGKVQLQNMRYGAQMQGFTPYAMRHFLSAFRDVYDLTLATSEMSKPGRLKPFTKIGFQLVDHESGTPISLTDIENGTIKPMCHAEFDFNDAHARQMAFSNLGLAPDAPSGLSARSNRVIAMATRAYRATIATVRH